MIRDNKGVTISSLVIYIIVAATIIVLLVFVNANFVQDVNSLNTDVDYSKKYTGFCEYFVPDIKSVEEVLEYSDTTLRLGNDVSYEIKKKEVSADTYEYAIYRNDVLVCDKLSSASFGYNNELRQVHVDFEVGDDVFTSSQDYTIGKKLGESEFTTEISIGLPSVLQGKIGDTVEFSVYSSTAIRLSELRNRTSIVGTATTGASINIEKNNNSDNNFIATLTIGSGDGDIGISIEGGLISNINEDITGPVVSELVKVDNTPPTFDMEVIVE